MKDGIVLEDIMQDFHMPENIAIGMMVSKQHKICKSIGCDFDYHGFAFGQSPFQVPEALQQALARHAEKGGYVDAEGIMELREAVAGFHRRYFKLDLGSERIFIGPGTKTLIHMIFTLVKARVILPSPSWVGYYPLLKLLGKEYAIFHLARDHGYKIVPRELDSFLAGIAGTKMLVLNNPHNPTGSVYSQTELEEIARVCRKHDTLILADEIYALTTYDFDQFTSMGAVYPEGTFITNGLSKDRSAGGYRLGVCVLPQQHDQALARAFKMLAATFYTSVVTPVQLAAVSAYKENTEIDEYFKITRSIHRIMGTTISRKCAAIEGLYATVPRGGFYFLLDFHELSPRLLAQGIYEANRLSPALISHPFDVATISGDSLLLPPDRFAVRIAFVDYDGEKAYRDYASHPPQNEKEEEEFVLRHAGNMISGVQAIQDFVEDLPQV